MRLVYTDTDSFVMEIKMPVNEALDKIRDCKYEAYFEFPDSKVKKIPGRLASEKTCKYFYAFASKHYVMDRKEKCKGVPKGKGTTELAPSREYFSIISKNHQIMIHKNIKKLKYEDDKKYYIDDEAYPYGYKGLYEYEK